MKMLVGRQEGCGQSVCQYAGDGDFTVPVVFIAAFMISCCTKTDKHFKVKIFFKCMNV